jgi:hypothetical protein
MRALSSCGLSNADLITLASVSDSNTGRERVLPLQLGSLPSGPYLCGAHMVVTQKHQRSMNVPRVLRLTFGRPFVSGWMPLVGTFVSCLDSCFS